MRTVRFLSRLFSTDPPLYLGNLKPCGCTCHRATDAELLISSIHSQPSGKHEKIPAAQSKVTIGRKLQKHILATGHFKSDLFIFPPSEWPGFILLSFFSIYLCKSRKPWWHWTINRNFLHIFHEALQPAGRQNIEQHPSFFLRQFTPQPPVPCQYSDKGFRVLTLWRWALCRVF